MDRPPSTSRFSLEPGVRLGPYEIVAARGAGGMGEVYQARDIRLNRFVAIKTMRGAFGERFEREARAISALNHPHICALYDIGSELPVRPAASLPAAGDAGWPPEQPVRFLVMEYVEGRSPAGPLPLDTALTYGIQIASALDAAHHAGIIHRDLKPANILVTDAGIKLLDFGLAKLVDASPGPDSAPALTEPHLVMGTPQYMSPEQIQGQAVDARSDLFSLGCLLYELISGHRPFVASGTVALMNAIVNVLPAPLTAASTLTPRVEAAVMRCLAKDPASRWQSASALLDELQRAAAERSPAPVPAGTTGWASKRAAMVAFAAVVLVCVVALIWRPSPGTPTGTIGTAAVEGALRFPVQAAPGARRDPAVDRFAVSPDGLAIAFSARRAGGASSIWVRRFNEAAAVELTGTDGGVQPFWSPDSHRLGFFRERAIDVVAREGGTPTTVAALNQGDAPLGGSWSDGTIVFAIAERGLFKVNERGGAMESVAGSGSTAARSALTWPQVLPGGTQLLAFASRDVGGSSAFILPGTGGEAVRLVRAAGAARYAAGVLVFPRVDREGRRHVVQSSFDPNTESVGSSVDVVTSTVVATADGGPDFAVADGVIAVQGEPQFRRQLTWVDRGGRTLTTLGPAATIDEFALAADGQRVVATIRDEATGRPDLWLLDGKRGEVSRLTRDGGVHPLWSRDSDRVFFTRPDDNAARVMVLESGEDSVFTLVGAPSRLEDITRDGRYLVMTTFAPPSEIWMRRTEDATEFRTLVKDVLPARSARISPNGRWLAYVLEDRARGDVFVQPFDRPGDRVRVSVSGGAHPVWRDDSRELFFEANDALWAVTIADDRGVARAGQPERALPIQTPGAAHSRARNVEVSGRGPRFLVNAVVGDSDNVPITVTLNWKPRR